MSINEIYKLLCSICRAKKITKQEAPTTIEFYGWIVGMLPIPFVHLLTKKAKLRLNIAHQISIKVREGEVVEISVASMKLAEEIISKSMEVGVKARIKEDIKEKTIKVARILFGNDNGCHMYDDRKEIPNICPNCHYPTKQEINPNFKLKKKLDVSYTYDGYLIVSDKFRLFCKEKLYRNLVFYEIPAVPGFYLLSSDLVIPLDYERRKVLFKEFCPLCGKYGAITGGTPSYMKNDFIVQNNHFYRSEYDFRSYWSRSPLIIVSLDLAKELSKEKFKGLYFADVLK